jgi:hypothetical protein
MSCRAEQHRRVQSAQFALVECDDVTDVTVVEAYEDPVDKPTLDVVLRLSAGGVSAGMADVVSEFRLTVRRVQRQGANWQALLVA